MGLSHRITPGFTGRESLNYVVSAAGLNEFMESVQDINPAAEMPDIEVPLQGIQKVRHLAGVQSGTGDATLAALDIYELAKIGGVWRDANRATLRPEDLGKVDIVRPHIDQDTNTLMFTEFIRGFKARSLGKRSGTGAAETIAISFTFDDMVQIEGAVYVDDGALSGASISLRNTPLVEEGLLRISVEVSGVLTDITDNVGTWGTASQPSYEVVESTGVVTLYGVSTGDYVVCYATATPDPYAIRDSNKRAAKVLPS